VRQLKNKEVNNLSIRAYWPRRMGTTIEPLNMVSQNPAILVPEGSNAMPTFIEVCRVIDLGARFKGAKTFVEDISGVIPSFYEDAGQHLSSWVAKAPKVRDKATDSTVLKPTLQAAPTIFSELFVTDKL
jgi:hypothetical protein